MWFRFSCLFNCALYKKKNSFLSLAGKVVNSFLSLVKLSAFLIKTASWCLTEHNFCDVSPLYKHYYYIYKAIIISNFFLAKYIFLDTQSNSLLACEQDSQWGAWDEGCGGGGRDSQTTQTGMLVLSLRVANFSSLVLLRVFQTKTQYFKLSRSPLGLYTKNR